MQSMRKTVPIPPDGKLRVEFDLPEGVDRGEAMVTVVVRKPTLKSRQRGSLDWFPTLNVGHWDPDTSLRRKDLYGDNGR